MITGWLDDEAVYRFVDAAPPSAERINRNWSDGTASADFYRGNLSTLALVYQAVYRNSGTYTLHCIQIIDQVFEHIENTWMLDGGDPDSGCSFAIDHLTGIFVHNPGLDVGTILYDLRMEIACLADCFRSARSFGR